MLDKIPYVLVVGDKEMEEGTVNVNKRGVENKDTVKFETFLKKVVKENAEKTIF